MAINRMIISGHGQIEINNCAFRRDGRIEAQCVLDDTDFATDYAENGMLLAIDRANHTIKFPEATGKLPIGVNYTSEHMYDERTPGLKNFYLKRGEGPLPRIGILAVGDKFTTNCISYDTTDFATEDDLKTALTAYKTTAVYGGIDTTKGAVLLGSAAPEAGPVLQVVEYTTMPDGQTGVMLQVLSV